MESQKPTERTNPSVNNKKMGRPAGTYTHIPHYPGFVTVREAAEILKIQESSVRMLIHTGRFQRYTVEGKRWVYLKKDDILDHKLWKYSRVHAAIKQAGIKDAYSVEETALILSDLLQLHIDQTVIRHYINKGMLPAYRLGRYIAVKYAHIVELKKSIEEEMRWREKQKAAVLERMAQADQSNTKFG